MNKKKNTSIPIPHSKQDCIELRIDGVKVGTVCYYHAPRAIAKLEDGDESIEVERWGVKKDFDKAITCDFGD